MPVPAASSWARPGSTPILAPSQSVTTKVLANAKASSAKPAQPIPRISPRVTCNPSSMIPSRRGARSAKPSPDFATSGRPRRLRTAMPIRMASIKGERSVTPGKPVERSPKALAATAAPSRRPGAHSRSRSVPAGPGAGLAGLGESMTRALYRRLCYAS